MTSNIALHSEIGALDLVLIHRPGPEIANVTPAMAAEVLYDDILNLPRTRTEHDHLAHVLSTVANVVEFEPLLADVLSQAAARQQLIEDYCALYQVEYLVSSLAELPASDLARQLIVGTEMPKDTLERYLNPLRHALPPLPNAFFTRDATMAAHQGFIIGSMAHRVRVAEALLLRAIFRHHPKFAGADCYFDGIDSPREDVTVEGGDLLVVREDVAVIGYSERTSVAGIDLLAQSLVAKTPVQKIIAVEIPQTRATIHLDMIFTMIDVDRCMVFPPLITGPNRSRAFELDYVGRSNRAKITEHRDVLTALAGCGLELKPLACGGENEFQQEREQWASGANFFAFAPGQIVGYAHNSATLDVLSNDGFDIIASDDIVAGKADLKSATGRVAVAIPGIELARGGGGCRCMTMPLHRQPVSFS